MNKKIEFGLEIHLFDGKNGFYDRKLIFFLIWFILI